MAKGQVKTFLNENNPLNNPNPTPKLDSKLSKKRDRKAYSAQRYQAKKQEYHQWYLQHKTQKKEQEKEQTSKYYGAEAIKILMSLKDYTELNQQKHKLWADFNWTLKDCAEDINDIVAIMKLEQVAGNLIRDYWETTKKETKKGKSWNSLSEEQQQRLIKYWGYEKARVENGYIDEEEKLARQSQEYLKEIELAKFHEERGKVKCSCYQCQAKEETQKEIKQKLKKELDDYDQQSGIGDKEQCPECNKWVKELQESGVCRKCLSKYE